MTIDLTQAKQHAAQFQRLQDEATEGPWRVYAESGLVDVRDETSVPVVAWMGFDESRREYVEHVSTARLIAESRNSPIAEHLKAACQRVEALEAELAQLRRGIERLQGIKVIPDGTTIDIGVLNALAGKPGDLSELIIKLGKADPSQLGERT